MTTIVVLKDRMLSDSMASYGDEHYPCQKIFHHNGELLGAAGNVPSIEKFMRWYRGKRKRPLELGKGDNVSVAVLNHEGIFVYNNTSFRDEVKRDYHGLGCGWPYVEAAMMAGADARRGIEIACALSRSCGLPIQEYLLEQAPKKKKRK